MKNQNETPLILTTLKFLGHVGGDPIYGKSTLLTTLTFVRNDPVYVKQQQ